MAPHLPFPSLNAVYRHDALLPSVVTAYLCASVSGVFVNKYLTTASEYKFPYSTVMVLLQLIIALIVAQLWKRMPAR
jgi:hypothetical protein